MTAKKSTMVLDDRIATPIFQSSWKIYKSFSFEVRYLTQNSWKQGLKRRQWSNF